MIVFPNTFGHDIQTMTYDEVYKCCAGMLALKPARFRSGHDHIIYSQTLSDL